MPTKSVQVIVGATYWSLNGVNVFSANLVRGLIRRGIDAHVLLTEEDSRLIDVNDAFMERPADVPFELLPVSHQAGWGAHWGAMVRYLEERAPCVYIPNSDWRHSNVSPLLSSQVRVIGVVHSDDDLHYDHVKRLGRYWDAITTTSPTIRTKVLKLDRTLRSRTTVVPIGVDLPEKPLARPERTDKRLRVIYPGTLKQHQKRVLDFPKIIEAATKLGVPVKMTIVGGGPDEARLRAACASLVERGLIEFIGVVTPPRVLELVAEHDVFLLTSEFEGMPNALLEAMGRGCVPLVTNMQSAVHDLIKDGENGHIVPIGGIKAFARKLKLLQEDEPHWRRLSLRAHQAVRAGKYGVDDMVDSYAKLVRSVVRNRGPKKFVRPAGELTHPPAKVSGVGLFPTKLTYEHPGIGRFPTRSDYRPFIRELENLTRLKTSPLAPFIRQRAATMKRLADLTVVLAAPVWTRNHANDFSAALARGLRQRGVNAHILLTEEFLDQSRARTPRVRLPDDVPFWHLPVKWEDDWKARWRAMARHLEAHAPCIYMPNLDYRHSCVVPLLSSNVHVVGVVHDDPLSYDHVRRLGPYWNAVVVDGKQTARAVRRHDASTAERMHIVSTGHDLPDSVPPARPADEPLRIVCLGRFEQEETARFKNLLDALHAAGVATRLTLLLADGSSLHIEEIVRAFSPDTIVRQLSAMSPDDTRPLYEQSDVYLCLSSGIDAEWQNLVEASARGCAPILWVSEANSTLGAGFIKTGENGYIFPPQNLTAVVATLSTLDQDRTRLNKIRDRAATSGLGCRGTGEVVEDYLEIFDTVVQHARTGAFRRPQGKFEPPPKGVAGVDLFAGEMVQDHPPASAFPRLFREHPALDEARALPDIDDFGILRQSPGAMSAVEVIVALPHWFGSYTDDFSARLVRALIERGVKAHILLTEDRTNLLSRPPHGGLPQPTDIPFEYLPVSKTAGWGAHWGAMVRYLEERAPCIYIPNYDWRHSCIAPLLSERVMTVGVMPINDALHCAHVQRLGRYWNQLVVCQPDIVDIVPRLDPTLAQRTRYVDPESGTIGETFIDLFYQVLDAAEHQRFVRPSGTLKPPGKVGDANLFWQHIACHRPGVGWFPKLFKDYADFDTEMRRIRKGRPQQDPLPLAEVLGPEPGRFRRNLKKLKATEVIVGLPHWTGVGIDTFALRLVRGLREHGLRAHILLTEERTSLVSQPEGRPTPPADLVEYLPVAADAGWGAHWGALVHYLEGRTPCIYIPNHDWRHSCVTPRLSDRVAVVGVVHSDDPQHRDHARRLGRYWDAIVAYNAGIAELIEGMDASLAERLYIIEPDAKDLVDQYLELFYRTVTSAAPMSFTRAAGPIEPPPADVDGQSIFPVVLTHDEPGVGRFPTRSPDYEEFVRLSGAPSR